MSTLTITDDAGAQILSCTIPDIDPLTALPAIMLTLRDLPKPKPPRKKRSDAGTSRKGEERP